MATYRLGVMYGDGIGPEVVQAAVEVLTTAAERLGTVKFNWVELPMGLSAIEKYGEAFPDITKKALKNCDGWILGPNDGAAYAKEHQGKRTPSGELRHSYDLYANIRPSKTLPGIRNVVGEADLVIVRENTEGFYTDKNMYVGNGEFMVTPETALSVGVFTKPAIERIAHAAFRFAMERRQHVTIVHKANVIKLGFGLFIKTCREVAEQYPQVKVDDYHVDAFAAQLVRRAGDFDVIVTENMFGDILSDLAAELVGGLGLAYSINASENQAMAQAVHGSAPDIAGKNVANPVGEMLSAVMLIDWLGTRHQDQSLHHLGQLVKTSILKALFDGVRTQDLGGDASTIQFTEAVVQRILRS
ncbi:isocitrate/isopropylmalate dehydrogenase family protein [Ammoniphilus resinae]|uniref:3-isopropylmalate dehydrogenase n=1 Tax=Ammoniphilus resinae TaxID=861532 RepID=A0ABS4GKQ2_9BACL|nr:isocitrate/isopropylmalate dehydrogenase family protein [Ammoniphilus resinae]MBP1930842.1 3-isopropylmalate dehydrogenase [Ammoniphilus resinae]